ncbi:MAG: hypothetical protein ACRCTX_24525 [Afipia sp.]
MTRQSLAVAAAMALAMSQPVFRHAARREPTDYPPPRYASHDAERIAKAEAKRARRAAKRAKQLEAKP